MNPGNANLPIGDLRGANREIGVPGEACRTLFSLPEKSLDKYSRIL